MGVSPQPAQTPDGRDGFLKRPVAPCFVPVPELDGLPPVDRTVLPVQQPPLVGGKAPATARIPSRRARRRLRAAVTAYRRGPRSRGAAIADLGPYLADADPGVRRTAVATLTEHIPDGYAPALLAALDDADPGVRRTAADGIRELVEVLPDPGAAGRTWVPRHRGPRGRGLPAGRAPGRQRRPLRHALGDPDYRVRIEAVRALVSVDDVPGVVAATGDESREVRIAAAAGLATLRGGPRRSAR